MQTLSQLNQHLDDEHTDVSEAVHEIGVRTWLQKQLSRGTKLAPVAAISKSLKLAEDFHRNGDVGHVGIEATKETDNIVSRVHWQHETPDDTCTFPSCDRRLNNYRNKAINCRQCGRLFCEPHTLYQSRLSRSANYEPVRGIWCRVCALCYHARPWYDDTSGADRPSTMTFIDLRRAAVNQGHLERNRLEKRLDRLLRRLSEPAPTETSVSQLWNLVAGKSAPRHAVEREIVEWEEEDRVLRCPYCTLPFSYQKRKHHCRLCGLVVCGDKDTHCSTLSPFNVEVSNESIQYARPSSSRLEIRMCCVCARTIFGIAQEESEHNLPPQYQRLYANLQQYRTAIEGLMPRFHALLDTLDSDGAPLTKSSLQDAGRVRKRLLDAFAHYDATAKRIKDSPTGSITQKQVQLAIYTHAAQFLQRNMTPLQSLPRLQRPKAAPADTIQTLSLDDLKSEERETQRQTELMTFREQHFLLSESVQEAARRRRFEEVSALRESLKDLEDEIARREAEIVANVLAE